jgi:hypothetical protein
MAGGYQANYEERHPDLVHSRLLHKMLFFTVLKKRHGVQACFLDKASIFKAQAEA